VIKEWQSRNYEGIESPLVYTIRRGKWTDRPVWTQYTTWWSEVSVTAGFSIDHPFLWYLLLWMPDPNNVSKKNVFILSGSVTGVSFTANFPAGNVTLGSEFLSGNIFLSGVVGVSIGGVALGFTMIFDDSTSYSVDISGYLVNSEIGSYILSVFCDSDQNTYGLCSETDVYNLCFLSSIFT